MITVDMCGRTRSASLRFRLSERLNFSWRSFDAPAFERRRRIRMHDGAGLLRRYRSLSAALPAPNNQSPLQGRIRARQTYHCWIIRARERRVVSAARGRGGENGRSNGGPLELVGRGENLMRRIIHSTLIIKKRASLLLVQWPS